MALAHSVMAHFHFVSPEGAVQRTNICHHGAFAEVAGIKIYGRLQAEVEYGEWHFVYLGYFILEENLFCSDSSGSLNHFPVHAVLITFYLDY